MVIFARLKGAPTAGAVRQCASCARRVYNGYAVKNQHLISHNSHNRQILAMGCMAYMKSSINKKARVHAVVAGLTNWGRCCQLSMLCWPQATGVWLALSRSWPLEWKASRDTPREKLEWSPAEFCASRPADDTMQWAPQRSLSRCIWSRHTVPYICRSLVMAIARPMQNGLEPYIGNTQT